MKTSHKIIARLSGVSSVIAASAVTMVARAQTLPVPANTDLREGDIVDVMLTVITWGLGIAGTVAVLFLIVGGFLYITAGGDERRLESAKTTLKNAIIGTVFILVSLVIVITLDQVLGQ